MCHLQRKDKYRMQDRKRKCILVLKKNLQINFDLSAFGLIEPRNIKNTKNYVYSIMGISTPTLIFPV